MTELDQRVRAALEPFQGIATPTPKQRRAAADAVCAVLRPSDFNHSLRDDRRVHVDVEAILGWPGFLTIGARALPLRSKEHNRRQKRHNDRRKTVTTLIEKSAEEQLKAGVGRNVEITDQTLASMGAQLDDVVAHVTQAKGLDASGERELRNKLVTNVTEALSGPATRG